MTHVWETASEALSEGEPNIAGTAGLNMLFRLAHKRSPRFKALELAPMCLLCSKPSEFEISVFEGDQGTSTVRYGESHACETARTREMASS